MRKIICTLLIILILFFLAYPFLQEFIAKDQCLDFGGSYNEQTKTCEGIGEEYR